MKVLMLTTSYPSRGDNRGIFIYHLVENLKRIGIDVDVLNITKYKELTGGAGIFSNIKKSWKAKLLFPFYILNFYFLIIKKSKKYDVIHANWELTAFLALLSKFFHNKKIILTERSSQIMYTNSKIMKLVLKYVYKNVDRLVVISNNSKKLINGIYDDLNPVVIHNGVNVPKNIKLNKNNLKIKLGIDLDSKLIIFVGRLTPVKDPESLIRGFASVSFKRKVLLIIGNGEEKNKLKELANKLRVKDKVIFMGDVKSEEIYNHMKIADVLVLPSIMETGGNVILEAIISGLPIVATRIGWADDFIVNNYNGFFIEKQNPKDIENKLNKILNDHKLLAKMKKNLEKTKSQLITWNECARMYEKEYKNLVLNY